MQPAFARRHIAGREESPFTPAGAIKSTKSGTNDFLKIFGNETFGFEYKGYKFIGLASGSNMRMGPGQIPRENLTWFFQEMERTDTAMPVIYVNHYPMDNGLNNWFEVMDALRPFHVPLILLLPAIVSALLSPSSCKK